MVIPAIDILCGTAVRLYKGNYEQKTIYGEPLKIAQKFKDMGVKYLHIVDLDGAKDGIPNNFDVIKQISDILPIQIGGGIRSAETADRYLKIADKVILGTIAIEKPNFLREMIEKYGSERIIVGVDVQGSKVAINGWTVNSNNDYLDFIKQLKQIGLRTIIATDISKDGTLNGPNWNMYERIKDIDINVIVSGGVACNDDIIKAKSYYGVIIGKSYYEGKVDLEKCLKE